MTRKAKDRIARLFDKGGLALPLDLKEQLFYEITVLRETKLTWDGGVIRHRRGAWADIQSRTLVPRRLLKLVEEFRVTTTGLRLPPRGNDSSLSGSVKEGETYKQAILREILEELGIRADPAHITLVKREFFPRKPSRTYPGVMNEYRAARFLYLMPPHHFDPEGYDERHRDGSLTHAGWTILPDQDGY